MLTYWWWPDTTLLSPGYRFVPVRFEPYDSYEYKFTKLMATDTPPTAYIAGYYKFVESAPQELVSVAANIDLTYPDHEWLLSKFFVSDFSNCGGWITWNCIADLTCAWMRTNPDRVLAWIPDLTSCSSAAGQGLVDADGNFVDCRTTGCNAHQCDWCSPGRYAETLVDVQGRTSVCASCPAGKSQIRGNQQSCDPCGIGYFSAGQGSAVCDACELGKYQGIAGETECNSCPDLMTTAAAGGDNIETCICPANSYRPCYTAGGQLRHQCKCNSGVYGAAQSRACLDCPIVGISCPMGSDEANIPCDDLDAENKSLYPSTLRNFWVSYEKPLSVYQCLGSENCLGGKPNNCGEGLKGIACGACDAGQYQASGACFACSDLESSILFFLSPIPVIVVLTFVLHKVSQAPVNVWGKPIQGLGGIGYLLLVYVQTAGAIMAVFPTVPSGLSVMSFSGMSTEVTGLFHMECAGPQEYDSRFILKLFIPQIIGFIMFITWALSQLVPPISMDKNVIHGAFGNILKTFFVTIATICFSLFQKYNHPNGEASMVSAAHMVLYSDTWNSLVSLAVVSVLLNCVLYLTYISRAMYIAPRHFHNAAFRRRWQFMIMKMRPSLHWWMIIVLVRAVLLALTSVLWDTAVRQSVWIALTLILYFGGSYALLPWRNVFVSVFDVMIHIGLLVMCLCLPFLFTFTADQDPVSDVSAVMIGIVGCSGCGLFFAVAYAIYSGSPAGRRAKRKTAERYAAEMVKIFPQIVEARLTSVMLEGIPPIDIQLVNYVTVLLDSELFARKTPGRLQWRSELDGNVRMQPITDKWVHPNWQTNDCWA